VLDLQCGDLQLATSPAADGSPATSLAAQLAWRPPPNSGGVRCCHVWGTFLASGGQPLAPPRWLGAACADGYRITDLLVPAEAMQASFTVQPEGPNGLVQELQHAAQVEVGLA
jgi:hypothetical protein